MRVRSKPRWQQARGASSQQALRCSKRSSAMAGMASAPRVRARCACVPYDCRHADAASGACRHAAVMPPLFYATMLSRRHDYAAVDALRAMRAMRCLIILPPMPRCLLVFAAAMPPCRHSRLS